MKKLISCASYYGSGSSAITDLIGEYEGVKSLTEYEFRFIHDIDGIMDLEYHLVINPNRHNSGHALKRFLKLSEFNSGTWFDKRYERFFDGQYKKITQEYIESLTDLKYPGYWYMDLYERGKCFYYRKSIEGKIAKILHLDRLYNKMPYEFTYCSLPTEEKFINLTQKYIADLIKVANKEDYDYLMMDQLTPSSNVNRCLRYFKNDICTFIVDRDPRDIFVANRMIWKGSIVPSEVDKFCKWFQFTRGCAGGQKLDDQKVMKIQFEDLIYCYTKKVREIEDFIGLKSSNHINPFVGFNPRRSVINTWMFKNYPNQDEIHYIEDHLASYLFDFESVATNKIEGPDPISNKRF